MNTAPRRSERERRDWHDDLPSDSSSLESSDV